MPESPRWLVQRDRQDEALKVLARIHADNDISDPYVQAEFAEIKAKLSFEKLHPAPSYFDLLLGSQRRRMWIGIGVVSETPVHSPEYSLTRPAKQFWQSMTGINVYVSLAYVFSR